MTPARLQLRGDFLAQIDTGLLIRWEGRRAMENSSVSSLEGAKRHGNGTESDRTKPTDAKDLKSKVSLTNASGSVVSVKTSFGSRNWA